MKKIKTKTYKFFSGTGIGVAGVVMALAFSFSAMAASPPSATGSVGYTALGLQRYANFDAHQTGANCTIGWDVTGNYNLTFNLTGDPTPYTHDASLVQTGQTLSGSGGYPAGGTHTYEWALTSGAVNLSAISFTADYTAGADALAPPTTMHVSGTIASNGTMSGTWDDNYGGGSRTGTWQSTAGAATKTVVDCSGKGNFHYSDVNGNWYDVDVQYVKVDGNKTWFAGPVTAGNVGAGNWLFAEVQDVGTPGRNGDKVWGSFATEANAKLGVASMTAPNDGPFNVTSGNLVVH